MKFSLQQEENRFLDWLVCRNPVLDWVFFFFGIPALLLVGSGIFVAVMAAVCTVLGIV